MHFLISSYIIQVIFEELLQGFFDFLLTYPPLSTLFFPFGIDSSFFLSSPPNWKGLAERRGKRGRRGLQYFSEAKNPIIVFCLFSESRSTVPYIGEEKRGGRRTFDTPFIATRPREQERVPFSGTKVPLTHTHGTCGTRKVRVQYIICKKRMKVLSWTKLAKKYTRLGFFFIINKPFWQ